MPADAPIPARLVTLYTLAGSEDRRPWEVALAEGQTGPGKYSRFRADRHGEPYPRLAAAGRIGHYDVEKIATILRYHESAGWTVGLEVSLSASRWDGVIQAAKDAYDFNRVTIFLDDEELREQVRRLTSTPTLGFGNERAQL